MQNRYQKISVLGEGAFGRVELARDLAQGNKVAIKYLKGQDPDEIERFHRELRLLKGQLNNLYVVDVLDYDLEHEPPYIVLEYCEQGSLRKWIGKEHPWSLVAEVLANIVSGVRGLHKLGGFHRDIKPDNILIAKDETSGKFIMKVADFGMARVPTSTNIPMTYNLGGTFGYIAPEVVGGEVFSQKADIYSVGVVGIELLTGRRSTSALDSLPADVPIPFRNLLRAMVSFEPAKRPEINNIAAIIEGLLLPPVATVIKAPTATMVPRAGSPAPHPQRVANNETGGTGDGLFKILLGGLALVGLASLAKGNDDEWDDTVQRYRGTDGRFRRG